MAGTTETADTAGTAGAAVELRAIGPEEAADLHAGGTGGIPWVADGPYDGTRDAAGMLAKAAAAGLYRPEWGMWAVVRRSDGAAVGGIGFHGVPQDGRVEIGYDLAPSARGNGHATEAVRLVTALALASAEAVAVVEAAVESGNTPSQRVLERAGYRYVGRDGEGLLRYEHRA
ncbi:GNAT family N-acetyltransferase [Streptacidiphilus sp. ASG 303]|uniref:GNAT family N-acetyltransferase n=1 Tax=Streptacidiphilus sp. ASG 303 TaxID=2896847 RepID=UPI001E50D2B8|nr:GNAT family N-acetyltransferase [Streptacidiphilus sp. ASG 303]MCD0482246.1 GNAT family N-acetyltransferase [Streptacidiphilus sp. ASG 303]